MRLADLVDPELAETVDALGGFDLDADTATLPTLPPVELSAAVSRSDLVVPGEPDVTIRVHRPLGIAGALPCVVSMHSGGYVLGDSSLDDQLFDRWCRTLHVVGVSVDYRRAPTTTYPGPLMDCYTALRWVHGHAGEFGIDPDRIGLHGVGAGGGLAAALALVARDHREVPLAFQVLDSAMIDDRQETRSSRLEDLPVWSSRSTEYGWRAYLGDLYGTTDVPLYAAASRSTDLRRLPPAFVSVGALDGFHDENVDYATRLNHAGIPTELHVYPGTPHGYHLASESRVARQSVRDKTAWLRRRLRP